MNYTLSTITTCTSLQIAKSKYELYTNNSDLQSRQNKTDAIEWKKLLNRNIIWNTDNEHLFKQQFDSGMSDIKIYI